MPVYEGGFDPPAPVARVDVIGPTGRQSNVPMLIDTGSDDSVVPRRVADAVGAAVHASPYRLELFDGSVVPAEEAEIIVRLAPYRFAGAYLVEDKEYGILGRNILRHLVLRLDGPRQGWTLAGGI
ncbi:MAG TPA: aspartyl protease family protein [Chloroflexota bacterium]